MSLYKVGMSIQDFTKTASYYHTMYENKAELSDNDIANMKSHFAIMEECLLANTYDELKKSLLRVLEEEDSPKIKENLTKFINTYLEGHQIDVNIHFIEPQTTTVVDSDDNRFRIKEKPDFTIDSMKKELFEKKSVEIYEQKKHISNDEQER